MSLSRHWQTPRIAYDHLELSYVESKLLIAGGPGETIRLAGEKKCEFLPGIAFVASLANEAMLYVNHSPSVRIWKDANPTYNSLPEEMSKNPVIHLAQSSNEQYVLLSSARKTICYDIKNNTLSKSIDGRDAIFVTDKSYVVLNYREEKNTLKFSIDAYRLPNHCVASFPIAFKETHTVLDNAESATLRWSKSKNFFSLTCLTRIIATPRWPHRLWETFVGYLNIDLLQACVIWSSAENSISSDHDKLPAGFIPKWLGDTLFDLIGFTTVEGYRGRSFRYIFPFGFEHLRKMSCTEIQEQAKQLYPHQYQCKPTIDLHQLKALFTDQEKSQLTFVSHKEKAEQFDIDHIYILEHDHLLNAIEFFINYPSVLANLITAYVGTIKNVSPNFFTEEKIESAMKNFASKTVHVPGLTTVPGEVSTVEKLPDNNRYNFFKENSPPTNEPRRKPSQDHARATQATYRIEELKKNTVKKSNGCCLVM